MKCRSQSSLPPRPRSGYRLSRRLRYRPRPRRGYRPAQPDIVPLCRLASTQPIIGKPFPPPSKNPIPRKSKISNTPSVLKFPPSLRPRSGYRLSRRLRYRPRPGVDIVRRSRISFPYAASPALSPSSGKQAAAPGNERGRKLYPFSILRSAFCIPIIFCGGVHTDQPAPAGSA